MSNLHHVFMHYLHRSHGFEQGWIGISLSYMSQYRARTRVQQPLLQKILLILLFLMSRYAHVYQPHARVPCISGLAVNFFLKQENKQFELWNALYDKLFLLVFFSFFFLFRNITWLLYPQTPSWESYRKPGNIWQGDFEQKIHSFRLFYLIFPSKNV